MPSLVEELSLFIEEKGGVILFSSEGEDHAELYANIPKGIELPPTLTPIFADLPTIDWENQWALHGVSELQIAGKAVKLVSGPGFGDFSHPTTQLMIEMMREHLQGEAVFDVGCGSGILSMAAVALGAQRVVGIDIEEEAIAHSQENALQNGFEEKATFCLPQEFSITEPMFVLMNMISSEQKVAWESVKEIPVTGMVTSGILKKERKEYLKWMKSLGLSLIEEREKEGWLAFYFKGPSKKIDFGVR